MDYYERIDRAIQYIENNLFNHIDLNDVATTAYMSLSNFYRLFFALTGYKVKEYIRYRRIDMAGKDLKLTKATVMELAIKYDYTGSDTFSRTFYNIVGYLPSQYRHIHHKYVFERIDIMDEYYDLANENIIKEYPEIKVLRKIESMRIAYFESYNENPEYHSFKYLLEWAKRANLLTNRQYRLFGYDIFNNYSNKHGYSACITIDDNLQIEDDMIKTKYLEGGLYAVTTVNVKEIESAWKRFKHWVKLSRYDIGTHQHLEEHIEGVDLSFDYDVQLMMPIVEKSDYEIVTSPPMTVILSQVYGDEENVPYEAWRNILNWSRNNVSITESRYYAFNNYNIRRKNIRRYYIAMVSCKVKPIELEKGLVLQTLEGGKYIRTKCNFNTLPKAWDKLINYINTSDMKVNPKLKWREEWHIKDNELKSNSNPEITIYCPIK